MGKLMIGFAVAMIALVAMWVKFENDNPCLEYGETHFQYMVQSGKVMIPIYGRDCIKRTHP